MSVHTALQLAYLFNIVVLAPVLWFLYRHAGPGEIKVIGGGVANSDGLRLLLASLWLAVLLLSLVGLLHPEVMVPLLMFQVVYKLAYLLTYVAPAVARDGWRAAPPGITAVFVAIVVAWPFLIARSLDALVPGNAL